jgi:hypothetical protein
MALTVTVHVPGRKFILGIEGSPEFRDISKLRETLNVLSPVPPASLARTPEQVTVVIPLCPVGGAVACKPLTLITTDPLLLEFLTLTSPPHSTQPPHAVMQTIIIMVWEIRILLRITRRINFFIELGFKVNN